MFKAEDILESAPTAAAGGPPEFSSFWDGIKDQKSIWAEADWKADIYEEDAEDNGMGEDPVLYTRDFIIRGEVEDRFYGLVNHIRKMMSEGMPCWRAMRLQDPSSAVSTDPIGTYWTTERASAASYNATEVDGVEVIFEAKTPESGVDWDGTLTAQLEISGYSEEEQEIRFLTGTKIYVNGVIIDGSFVKIDDWRTV